MEILGHLHIHSLLCNVNMGIQICLIFMFFVFLLSTLTCYQSKTGALEGPEVDGFVKDMMELVRVRFCKHLHSAADIFYACGHQSH